MATQSRLLNCDRHRVAKNLQSFRTSLRGSEFHFTRRRRTIARAAVHRPDASGAKAAKRRARYFRGFERWWCLAAGLGADAFQNHSLPHLEGWRKIGWDGLRRSRGCAGDDGSKGCEKCQFHFKSPRIALIAVCHALKGINIT
jgi:hypothetical protein